MYVVIRIFGIIFILLSATAFPVVIEEGLENKQNTGLITIARMNVERFREELARYESEVRKKSINTLWRRGALIGAGAGVGLLSTIGIVSVFSQQSTMISSQAGMHKKTDQGSSTKSQQVVDLFKQGMILSFTGSLAALFLEAIRNMASYVKKEWWSGDNKNLSLLIPLSMRIQSMLLRINFSMIELQKHTKKDLFLFKHYLFEIVDAFTVLVRALEQCGAVLLYELQRKHGKEHVVVVDYKNFLQRLFTFSECIAMEVEADLNRENWTGFRNETFEFFQHFMTSCSALFPAELRQGKQKDVQ